MIQWKKFSEEKPDFSKPLITYYNHKGENIHILDASAYPSYDEDYTHWAYINLPEEEK